MTKVVETKVVEPKETTISIWNLDWYKGVPYYWPSNLNDYVRFWYCRLVRFGSPNRLSLSITVRVSKGPEFRCHLKSEHPNYFLDSNKGCTILMLVLSIQCLVLTRKTVLSHTPGLSQRNCQMVQSSLIYSMVIMFLFFRFYLCSVLKVTSVTMYGTNELF